jgi:hypothetical protein
LAFCSRTDDEMRRLGKTERERSAATLKASLSFIPHVGGALTEIVNHFIPDQRIESVENSCAGLNRNCRTSTKSRSARRQAAQSFGSFRRRRFSICPADKKRSSGADRALGCIRAERLEKGADRSQAYPFRDINDVQIIILA